MAVLPENSIDLSGGVEFVAQPSLTWKIDRAAGRIAGTCDGYDAVKQAVEIILNVEPLSLADLPACKRYAMG